MSDAESTHQQATEPASVEFGKVTPEGRLLIDSEALAQAVYLYRPVWSDDGADIVDLLIVAMNEPAHRLRLAEHIREGALASTVFVDLQKALDAANAAWQGKDTVAYHIDRRSMVGAQPILVHYEVSTLRVGDHLAQVSVDHTTVEELHSAESLFTSIAEQSPDGLVLFSSEPETQRHLVAYANPAARSILPSLRVGEPPPHALLTMIDERVVGLVRGEPLVVVTDHLFPTRRATLELTYSRVNDDILLLTIREITPEAGTRSALERSDRILEAIGAGSFGSIAVYEPMYSGTQLVDLGLAWSSERESADGQPRLSHADVMSASRLVELARGMVEAGDHRRSGWASVNDGGNDRTVEFALVHAGDRFVLEFVERTEELKAQTTLAMVRAGEEAQRSFVSRISHELRSPLNVIHGYSQLLVQLGLSGVAASHVAVVERGVERMVQVVDDLLLLGQIDQGLLHTDVRNVRNDALVDSLLAGAERCQWWRAGALVCGVHDAVPVVVRTDPARFTSVALLVAEASVAVQPGIEVKSFGRGARAGIQFVVPRESSLVESVWRPFLHSHTIPGTGMGLAVARSMAAMLKVSLELREGVDLADTVSLVMLTHIAG